MKKKLFMFLFAVFYSLQSCFDVDKKLIYEYPYHGDTICFFYIPGNATSQNMMQICLLDSTGTMRILGNYELYNHVVSIDTTIDGLRIVLRDTSSHYVFVQDTICIDLLNGIPYGD